MSRNSIVVLVVVLVVLALGAYFFWAGNPQTPSISAPATEPQAAAPAPQAQNPPPQVAASGDPDEAVAAVLNDGSFDAASPADSDQSLAAGDEVFVASSDESFAVSQF